MESHRTSPVLVVRFGGKALATLRSASYPADGAVIWKPTVPSGGGIA